ncbi:MAG: DUF4349 domain-containing protein [Flavobacteriales bacterium]|nr:DUF4349 domain-containing protein [Flavobacteriales bacterium]
MKSTLLTATLIAVLTLSCGNGMDNRSYSDDSPSTEYAKSEGAAMPMEESSPAATEQEFDAQKDEYLQQQILSGSTMRFGMNDSLRKFIRTADIRFRVKDVIRSSYRIEEVTEHLNGYVQHSDLHSTIQKTEVIRISNDSILERTHYVTENVVTLRVPARKTDSLLKAIASEVEHLDYRVLDAEDIRYELLEKDLLRKRNEKFKTRMSSNIEDNGKKLNDVTNAEESILRAEEESDAAFVDRLRRLDLVEYATITLTIYQRENFKDVVLANEKNLTAYEPSFWSKMGDSLKTGWYALEELLVELTKGWFFILLIIVLYYFLRKKFRKNKVNS